MESVAEYFQTLVEYGRADGSAWPVDLQPEQLGLGREGRWIVLPESVDLLNQRAIEGGLSNAARQWSRSLEVFPAIDSTNSALMALGASIGGTVYLAECQTGGRGRRGRTWFSPFAGNLAMSLGFELGLPPADLGGLSLVVGLALVNALEQFSVPDVGLKWPNDVQVAGKKISGILVELQMIAGRTYAVIGIGINVALPRTVEAAIDQQVTDLRSHTGSLTRSTVAATVINSTYDFVSQFVSLGFEPLRDVWNSRHVLDGCMVDLHGPAGVLKSGRVVGVGGDGALLLECDGVVEAVVAGEVSVRQQQS